MTPIDGRPVFIGAGGEKPQLTVTAPTGSAVTATQGGVTMQTTEESGTWTFHLPSFGVWTVTATKDGESASDTVDVQQDYSTTLSYKPTASLTPTSGVTYTSGISTLTAEKMNLYGEAISNNASITDTTSEIYINDTAAHYKVSVGDSINLTVNGASYEFVILGFNHDELTTPTAYGASTATGKAGITLLMRNCLTTINQMNASNTNEGGWNGCAFRTTLQSTIKNSMDSAWQSAIKTVKKLASAGKQSTSITTSNDTLFLLSEIEIFGSITNSKSGEGHQYAWYTAGNTSVKYANGSAASWWGRSPYKSNSTDFCRVHSSGNSNNGGASVTYGIAFALCI